eukprot:TRINITY_DN5089_c0_g1_i2.p1 TRINITY_DN5089_c0_g1~~TRINITY_DN5089_c0_g1_i2.p1  ORF type:complete len:762 (+),score=237.56 TRINITY_DN5089_c0_g1_i2:151-2286(+)
MLGGEKQGPSLQGSTITVTLVEGRSMPAAKAYSCILKLSAKTHTSGMSSKTNAPKWNQDFKFELMEGDAEVQLKVFQKRFCIGEVVVPLQPFIRFEATKLDKWYKIKSTSHVEVEGEIHVVTHLHLRQAALQNRSKKDRFSGTGRTSSHLALLELETAALTKDLLDNLPTGPKTSLERMEQAVLEEHDFISKELARVNKTDDSDSQKKQTIQEMLDLLVQQSDRMQLAPQKPFNDLPAVNVAVVENVPVVDGDDEGHAVAARPKLMLTREVSPTLARLITNLGGEQRKQREALLTLQSHLKEDEDAVDFVHGGGIQALLDIVIQTSSESFQLKALEHLSTITFEDAPRRHVDLVHMMRTLQPLLDHPNEDIAVLAASSFTNGCMSVNEEPSVRQYVCDGEATDPIMELLLSSHDYIQLRALWALSHISFAKEQALAKRVIPKITMLLKESKKKEALQMACLLVTNMAAYESNLDLLVEGDELLEALFVLLSSAFAVVVVQALKAFTNLAQHARAREYLCSEGMTEKLTSKLRTETPYNNVKMQSAWLVSSMAQDEETSRRVVELGYVDAIFQLLSDEGVRQQRADIRLKALWALINMSVFTDLSQVLVAAPHTLESIAALCTCGQSAVRLHALKLLASVLTSNSVDPFLLLLFSSSPLLLFSSSPLPSPSSPLHSPLACTTISGRSTLPTHLALSCSVPHVSRVSSPICIL